MAAVPSELARPDGRRSSSSSTRVNLSHGRGGAGNIASNTPNLDPVSLETPTLKTDVFTTGRGGSGNMAKNSDPETARRAQDVVAHPRSETPAETHVGRGGAANVFRPADEERGREGDAERRPAGAPREMGLADKGKEWLTGVIAGKK